MKKLISILLLITMLCTTALADDTTVIFNGKTLLLNGEPYAYGNTYLLPMRSFFEAIGYVIGWDEDTKSVTATGNNNRRLSLQIGNYTVYINGVPRLFNLAPSIINDLTYVSADIVSALLECEMKFGDGKLEIVDEIRSGGYSKYPGTQVISFADRFSDASLYAKGYENNYKYYTYYASEDDFDRYCQMLYDEGWEVSSKHELDNTNVLNLQKTVGKSTFNMTLMYGLMTFNSSLSTYVKIIFE